MAAMAPRLLALIFATSVPVHAAAVSTDQARTLAATCLACHAPVQGGAKFAPRLEGMDSTRLATTLRAYRTGEGSRSVMRQLARGYGDAEIQALADWFATQPRP
jgi:cytochrome subunit of sulfide dehydrogenase